MTSRALLIGIDGVRLDTLREVATPRIDALIAEGFLTTATIPPVNRVMSGAMWATILTGVWADRHGVKYNWWPSRRLRAYPDVLQRINTGLVVVDSEDEAALKQIAEALAAHNENLAAQIAAS